jgi:hypothetical protein
MQFKGRGRGASPCLVERSVRLQSISKRPTVRRSWWGPSPSYPVIPILGRSTVSTYAITQRLPKSCVAGLEQQLAAGSWPSGLLWCAVPRSFEGNKSCVLLLSCPRKWALWKHGRGEEQGRMAWSPQLVLQRPSPRLKTLAEEGYGSLGCLEWRAGSSGCLALVIQARVRQGASRTKTGRLSCREHIRSHCLRQGDCSVNFDPYSEDVRASERQEKEDQRHLVP